MISPFVPTCFGGACPGLNQPGFFVHINYHYCPFFIFILFTVFTFQILIETFLYISLSFFTLIPRSSLSLKSSMDNIHGKFSGITYMDNFHVQFTFPLPSHSFEILRSHYHHPWNMVDWLLREFFHYFPSHPPLIPQISGLFCYMKPSQITWKHRIWNDAFQVTGTIT